MNVPGWLYTYPVDGSAPQDVAQTYLGELPGMSISR
jgi:hypothetical protein